MNETIGSKGGHNDRKRQFRIIKKQKDKLKKYQKEEEIKELEKKVRKKQIYTMVKALPIAIAGGTFKILYDATDKKEIDKQTEYSKWRIKEYDSDFTTKSRQEKNKTTKQVIVKDFNGKKIIVNVYNLNDFEKKDKPLQQEEQYEDIKTSKEINKIEKTNTKPKEEKFKLVDDIEKDEYKNIENVHSKGLDYKFNIYDGLTNKEKEKLSKLQSRKIIDEYEKQLKDIRYDLRNLVFEYNVLVDGFEKSIKSKELDDILDKLNELIVKIEQLKDKIKIDNLDKYDDNYIYSLIEDYLLEFKDKKVIDEIKDSPLYIMISEKLNEVDTKKDSLKEKINRKKEEKEIKEEEFERLKEKYYSFEKINKDLLNFKNEQDMLLKEIQEKIKNAVTVSEKVEVQVEYMNYQTRRLLRVLSRSLFVPMPRAARSSAAFISLYISFMREIVKPTTTTKKYKVITVSDYSKDIEYSIKSIDNALNLLSKTNKQIDKLIFQINDEFGDYLGVVKECDELLSNLRKVKNNLNEKEYEMEKIKKSQERELEKNNAKVLTRGKYPV